MVLAHPPEAVFDLLSDPRKRPLWQSSLLSVDVPPGPPRAGLAWRDRTVVGVRPHLVVTVHEPPTAWAEVGTWRGVTASLRVDLSPSGSSCRVLATGEVRGEGVWAVPAQVAGVLAGRAIASDLRRAGRVLDSGRGD